MRGLSAGRILLLATAAAALGWGATPTIATLQSSRNGNPPANVTAITSGTASLANGFTLYINGSFTVNAFINVRWFNPSTNVTTLFDSATASVTPTLISVIIPNALFQTPVASPVAVTVTVLESGGSSAATFTINPPLQAVQPILPSGTNNVAYSASLITGGTPPFDAGVTPGTPPGLTPQSDATLAGTPTLANVFNFQTSITDIWGNSVQGNDTLEIVNVPLLSSISPHSSGVGAGSFTLTVTGSNFVGPVTVGAQQIPGSKVQWRIGNVVTELDTAPGVSGTLNAIVPSALLAAPAVALVSVKQPSNATSNQLPFSVAAPTISSIVPPSVPAGSNATTFTVNGANFVVNAAASSKSTVSLNGAPLNTTFGDSATLTADAPAGMLLSPIVYNVRVTNPGGVGSNQVTFSVVAPAISSLSVTSVVAGSPAFALIVTGANYLSGSQVSLNGTPQTATFGGSGSLTTTVPASLLTVAGVVNVQVINPGGTPSNTLTFNVVSPPILATVSPTSVPAGSAFPLAVTGANFLSGAQISLNGSALITIFGSSTALTANVPASMVGTVGQLNVQIINPGGALSNTLQLNVVGPSLATLPVTSVPAGSPALGLTVSGANFVSGSQVSLNGVAQTTTFGGSGSLTITVPASVVTAPGVVNVQVINPGGAASNTQQFTVGRPSISGFSPPSIPAGSATFSLGVIGANFVSGSRVTFDGGPLTTNFSGPTLLNATVPASLVTGPKLASIVVINPGIEGDGSTSLAASFTVASSLAIVTTALSSGSAGNSYSFTLTGRGGTPPYTWAANGLPPALSVNPATGVISGALLAGGAFPITVVLQDAAKSTATAQFPLAVGPPPPSIIPSTLPSGVVGVGYAGFIAATGGSGPYTFALGGGKLPDGLTLSSGGTISGTPKTPGQFSFSVVATDTTGESASRDFGIAIQPAPLTIPGGPGPGPTVPAGTPISIPFTPMGGVSPYSCAISGNVPPGTTFTNCVLSGTPNTAGTYNFQVTAGDAAGGTVTKGYTIIVSAAPPVVLNLIASLDDGKVGVPYSGRVSASGGTGPYTFTGSGLPDGLVLSLSGSVSGTPINEGKFPFEVTASDSKGASGTGTFPILILPADLVIVTSSLPDGVVGIDYSATLNASGGRKPYIWTVNGLPDGVTATAAGVISGTPKTAGKFTVNVSVKDAVPGSVATTKVFSVTIAPPPLVITTTTAPNGTVGTPYSASFNATGGTPPLTFSATGLPAGLTMSAAGTISGTPTAPGAATIVVTVKDAAGASTSKSFPVTIVLPATPPLNFTGLPATASPLQQLRLQVSLGSAYPVDVVVTLTLSFDGVPDDPSIQFSSGGRTARITIPAGATNGATDVGVQTGSVAGLITVTAQMQAAGQDITPSPAPRTTIRIAAAAPVIVPGSLTAVRNSTGFTVTLTGYVTDRELTQAIFQFNAAAGSNLQTTTLTVQIDAMFAQYFSSANSALYGSQFTYTQPFTVTGSTQAIASVTVTLVNKIGQSTPVTATLN